MTLIWRMCADFSRFLESALIRLIRVIRVLFHGFVGEV
jgi:hypothetical protein